MILNEYKSSHEEIIAAKDREVVNINKQMETLRAQVQKLQHLFFNKT